MKIVDADFTIRFSFMLINYRYSVLKQNKHNIILVRTHKRKFENTELSETIRIIFFMYDKTSH